MAEQFKPKKTILRKCVGCGNSFEKKSLIRIVRSPEGEVSLDFNGKKSGRGAYLCHSVSCFKKAIKSKRLERNLDCAIPQEVIDKLEGEFISND